MTLDRVRVASEYLGSAVTTIKTTNSIRGCVVIRMPFSTDLTLLRGMSPATRSLTRAQVVLYGGIPALIYTALTDEAFDPDQRVYEQLKSSPLPRSSKDELIVLKAFIYAVLTGNSNPKVDDSNRFRGLSVLICFVGPFATLLQF
jgi:hypothetical protein